MRRLFSESLSQEDSASPHFQRCYWQSLLPPVSSSPRLYRRFFRSSCLLPIIITRGLLHETTESEWPFFAGYSAQNVAEAARATVKTTSRKPIVLLAEDKTK